MEIFLRNNGCIILHINQFVEIQKSFAFAKEQINQSSVVQKTVYLLHIKLIIDFLQKVTHDFNFYYLPKKHQELVIHQLHECKQFYASAK